MGWRRVVVGYIIDGQEGLTNGERRNTKFGWPDFELLRRCSLSAAGLVCVV